jgi:hypothetical protein
MTWPELRYVEKKMNPSFALAEHVASDLGRVARKEFAVEHRRRLRFRPRPTTWRASPFLSKGMRM